MDIMTFYSQINVSYSWDHQKFGWHYELNQRGEAISEHAEIDIEDKCYATCLTLWTFRRPTYPYIEKIRRIQRYSEGLVHYLIEIR